MDKLNGAVVFDTQNHPSSSLIHILSYPNSLSLLYISQESKLYGPRPPDALHIQPMLLSETSPDLH